MSARLKNHIFPFADFCLTDLIATPVVRLGKKIMGFSVFVMGAFILTALIPVGLISISHASTLYDYGVRDDVEEEQFSGPRAYTPVAHKFDRRDSGRKVYSANISDNEEKEAKQKAKPEEPKSLIGFLRKRVNVAVQVMTGNFIVDPDKENTQKKPPKENSPNSVKAEDKVAPFFWGNRFISSSCDAARETVSEKGDVKETADKEDKDSPSAKVKKDDCKPKMNLRQSIFSF